MATESPHLGSRPASVGNSWIPEDPRMYDETDHFTKRAESRDRVITRDLAAEIISRADEPIIDGSDWRFELDSQGMRVFLFCTLKTGMIPVVKTGFARVFDWQTAMQSSRWSSRQVMCEHVRNILHAEEEWPEALEPLDWVHPISVKGHPVTTDPGERVVHCEACHRQMRDWADLNETPCDLHGGE